MIAPEKVQFFEKMDEQELALTYDDVRMKTRSRHEPLPDEIDISSKFTTNIDLKVPIVSAAMDTVTDSDMAIEMAKLGGLGVIHSAMPIKEQFEEVRRVKKASHGLIDTPITVNETQTLRDVLQDCDKYRFSFRTFPVSDNDGKMVGVLTGKDFEYPESLDVTVKEAMTPAEDVHTAPVETELQEAYDIMRRRKITTLPILSVTGEVEGLYLWSDVKRNIREADKYNVDDNRHLISAAAITTGPTTMDRIDALRKYTDVFVLQSADGDSPYIFETLKDAVKNFKGIEIAVGNITEGASALELVEAGASGVLVGQGPGAICSTRRETGIGKPQVTAGFGVKHHLIKNGYGHIPVCLDGGISNHGDIPIAFAVMADSVMVGKMLAGTAEAPGEVIIRKDGSRVKVYRGMGSPSALMSNEASKERYNIGSGPFLAEGVEAYVPYEGDLKEVLGLCVAALRKGMRYVKAPDIKTHQQNTLLMRITNAGLRESHPHDVEVIT